MTRRIWKLAKARLQGEWFGEGGGSLPIAPLLFQGMVSSALLFVVRGDLDPHGHAVFAFTLLMALSLLSLLGELAPLLAHDPAEEWVGGLPVQPRDIRLSKILVCGLILAIMSFSVTVPAALLAPEGASWPWRLSLVALGVLFSGCLTATGLMLHAFCQGARSGLLVLLQAMLFVGMFVGFATALGQASKLAGWQQTSGVWLALPSTWFAAPLAPQMLGMATYLLIGFCASCAAILHWAPFPPNAKALGTHSLLGSLLRPLRAVATSVWVRPKERPIFDWIFEGLPAEKDFALRTYPLMAIPLAFLFLGADAATPQGQGLLAILCFAPLTYLPILLLFVPTTATPDARTLLDTAPLHPRDEAEGARKAVAIRIVLPLYVGLAVLVSWLASVELALQLIPPAAGFTVLLMRNLWNHYVEKPPLSTPASELGGVWRDDLTGGMFFLAIISVGLALITWRYVPGATGGIILACALLAIELGLSRRATTEWNPSTHPRSK
ncbi:MAG: hypothetical protein JKY61_08130 [Planctomycetes bacterium]|nr:hypothetical protein [Planctomycetota bacterium]